MIASDFLSLSVLVVDHFIRLDDHLCWANSSRLSRQHPMEWSEILEFLCIVQYSIRTGHTPLKVFEGGQIY